MCRLGQRVSTYLQKDYWDLSLVLSHVDLMNKATVVVFRLAPPGQSSVILSLELIMNITVFSLCYLFNEVSYVVEINQSKNNFSFFLQNQYT